MDIRSWFTHKARSQRGASLSMALMLMLVCVTVASIALTAGTASVGRLSQLQKMEKSYYNVTSAAKLFASELDGKKVEVVRACNAIREAEAWNIDKSSWSLKIDGIDATSSPWLNSSNATIFQMLACDLLFGTQKKSWDDREVSLAQINASMRLDVANPAPDDIKYDIYDEYSPIDVSVSDAIKQHFADVKISVRRDKEETFSFIFTEADASEPDSNSSSAKYKVVASLQKSKEDKSPQELPDGRFAWTTEVEWRCLYVISGDSS